MRTDPDNTRTPLYSEPRGVERPLRVALVVPPAVPQWAASLLALGSDYPWLDLLPVIAIKASLPKVEGTLPGVRLVVRLENALLGPSRVLQRTSVNRVDGHGGTEPREEPLGERLVALRPDLVIVFGDYALAENLSAVATHGCWWVAPELLDDPFAAVALLAPMLRGEHTTHVGLVLRQPDGTEVELAASRGQTRAGSFFRQRETALLKLPGLLLRALRRLAGGESLAPPKSMATLRLSEQGTMPRFAGGRTLWRIVKATARRVTGRNRDGSIGWTIVLRLTGAPMNPDEPAIGSHALLRPRMGWWADPFVVTANGRRLIFAEEMLDTSLNNANIACVELAGGRARRLGIALDEPGHLSFPQVFECDGHWYMTVESSYERRVSLYRAARFPLEWVRVHDMVSGRVCVDPTLHRHDGYWYLFTNVSENGNSTSDELFLFFSEALEGPYKPHPASPLVCDVRRARMAGQLFSYNGRLIRPSQDCGPGYGNAVVFNEIQALSPTDYREKTLSRLAPRIDRRIGGCHTYNTDGTVEVLDVFGHAPASSGYVQIVDAAEAGTAPEPAVNEGQAVGGSPAVQPRGPFQESHRPPAGKLRSNRRALSDPPR